MITIGRATLGSYRVLGLLYISVDVLVYQLQEKVLPVSSWEGKMMVLGVLIVPDNRAFRTQMTHNDSSEM